MKVFQLNSAESWYGPDLETCIRAAVETCGGPRDEFIEEEEIHEYAEEELAAWMVDISDEEDEEPCLVSAKWYLQDLTKKHGPNSCGLFLSSEW